MLIAVHASVGRETSPWKRTRKAGKAWSRIIMQREIFGACGAWCVKEIWKGQRDGVGEEMRSEGDRVCGGAAEAESRYKEYHGRGAAAAEGAGERAQRARRGRSGKGNGNDEVRSTG